VGEDVPRRTSGEFHDESHHLAEAASAGAGRRHPGADPVSRRPADANAACTVATLLVGITGRMTSWEARSAVSAPPILVVTFKALGAFGLPPADCLGQQGILLSSSDALTVPAVGLGIDHVLYVFLRCVQPFSARSS
jgi:hypothetical protein